MKKLAVLLLGLSISTSLSADSLSKNECLEKLLKDPVCFPIREAINICEQEPEEEFIKTLSENYPKFVSMGRLNAMTLVLAGSPESSNTESICEGRISLETVLGVYDENISESIDSALPQISSR